jgi:hypothetical protein
MDMNKQRYGDLMQLECRHKVLRVCTFPYMELVYSDKTMYLVNVPYIGDYSYPDDIILEHNTVVSFIVKGEIP